MAVSGVGTKANEIKIVDPDKIGFNGLTSEDFMKILIEQLKNQDPTDPMDSDQMLSQISQMRSLQSNIELQTTLKSLTLSQQLNSATDFIGKTVTGKIGDTVTTGEVTSVLVKDGAAILKLGDKQMKLADVTGITP